MIKKTGQKIDEYARLSSLALAQPFKMVMNFEAKPAAKDTAAKQNREPTITKFRKKKQFAKAG